MSQRTVKCYTMKMRGEDGAKVSLKNSIEIIEKIFRLPCVKVLDNNNKCLLYTEKDENNYMSLEYINKINNKEVDDNYMFFRIGRQRDIEGAIKRNINTFEGKEIIDINEQDEYNLEICTYLIIDKENGIICELYGMYAPNVKTFIHIINKNIEKLGQQYTGITAAFLNIMTDKMITSFAGNAEKLGKIEYKFEKPSIKFMKELNMPESQMIALRELDILEVEVTLKGKNKIPLANDSLKIKNIVEILSKLPKGIKDKLKIWGKTHNSNTKDYTFNEENVTYRIDVPVSKKENGEEKSFSLEEMGEEVYKRISNLYEKNKEDLMSYIQ